MFLKSEIKLWPHKMGNSFFSVDFVVFFVVAAAAAVCYQKREVVK